MTLQPPSNANHAPGGVLVIGADGRILQSPEFFQRALFLDQREVPSIYHLFDSQETPHLVLNKVFRHPYGGIEYHLRVDGLFGSRHGFRYWPLSPEEPPPEGESTHQGPWSFFIIDDSALIQTHDWRVRRLRREILSDLKESLSIHFKNRLATVQLLAETIRDAPEIASESSPRLLRAVAALHRAFNLVITGIDDIRTPAEYEDAPIRLGDLDSVINTWGKANVAIECELKNVQPATLIPASSIERVLFPLVENAMEASTPGGLVQVRVAETDQNFAHVEIIDRGEGMTERVLGRSQDPFFTTRTGRLGLGLAHAREALRDAGGQWQFESAPGEGTTVTVLLPVTTSAHLFR